MSVTFNVDFSFIRKEILTQIHQLRQLPYVRVSGRYNDLPTDELFALSNDLIDCVEAYQVEGKAVQRNSIRTGHLIKSNVTKTQTRELHDGTYRTIPIDIKKEKKTLRHRRDTPLCSLKHFLDSNEDSCSVGVQVPRINTSDLPLNDPEKRVKGTVKFRGNYLRQESKKKIARENRQLDRIGTRTPLNKDPVGSPSQPAAKKPSTLSKPTRQLNQLATPSSPLTEPFLEPRALEEQTSPTVTRHEIMNRSEEPAYCFGELDPGSDSYMKGVLASNCLDFKTPMLDLSSILAGTSDLLSVGLLDLAPFMNPTAEISSSLLQREINPLEAHILTENVQNEHYAENVRNRATEASQSRPDDDGLFYSSDDDGPVSQFTTHSDRV